MSSAIFASKDEIYRELVEQAVEEARLVTSQPVEGLEARRCRAAGRA